MSGPSLQENNFSIKASGLCPVAPGTARLPMRALILGCFLVTGVERFVCYTVFFELNCHKKACLKGKQAKESISQEKKKKKSQTLWPTLTILTNSKNSYYLSINGVN